MNSLRQFDLNLLVILEALISECHVSRAADKVHLSQSAMSHALNRLRAQLDDPILIRVGQGLKPSPRAEEMLPEIKKALGLIEQQLSPPPPFNPVSSKRVFTLAVTDYVETVILPDLLPELLNEAPNITLNIEMIGHDLSLATLESKKTDLVIGLEPAHTLPDGLASTPWLQESYVILAASHHPTLGGSLTQNQYAEATHIAFSDTAGEHNHNLDQQIDQWLCKHSLNRHIVVRTVNYSAAARIVANTHAITTVPMRMATLFCSQMPLKVLIPPTGLPSLNMQVIYHNLHTKDPALTWLKSKLFHYANTVSKKG